MTDLKQSLICLFFIILCMLGPLAIRLLMVEPLFAR